jgi:RNA polymerase sigma-70 factor (ECF subfamily)
VNEPASSFEATALACRPRIYRAACLLLDDPHEAEDVTQRVFVDAWRGWARFEGRSSAFTWLYRILVRTCARHRRRYGWLAWRLGPLEAAEAAASLADPAPGPDEHHARSEARADVRAMLRAMSLKLRAVLVLRYVEDCTVPEIARALGIPEGTVKSRLNYALESAARLWRTEHGS